MEVVGLLVDDSLGQCDGFSKETALILLIGDDQGIQNDQDEGDDGERHSKVCEGHVRVEALLETDDEGVTSKVVGNAAG